MELRNTLKECTILTGTENRGKFVNLNPEPPNMRGLIQIHKENTLILPVVNFKNSPPFKLVKMSTASI